MFWTNLIIPSENPLKVLAQVTAVWEFIIEKSRISASFLRVDVKDGVELKIFVNYDLIRFEKHSGTLVGSILKTSSQKEGWSKTNSLHLGVFFESAFVVELAGVAKLVFVILSEVSFLQLISRVSTSHFYCCWPNSGIGLTKVHTFALYALSVPILINEFFKNGLIVSNLITIR